MSAPRDLYNVVRDYLEDGRDRQIDECSTSQASEDDIRTDWQIALDALTELAAYAHVV